MFALVAFLIAPGRVRKALSSSGLEGASTMAGGAGGGWLLCTHSQETKRGNGFCSACCPLSTESGDQLME